MNPQNLVIGGINVKDKYAMLGNCHERQLLLMGMSLSTPEDCPVIELLGKDGRTASCFSP